MTDKTLLDAAERAALRRKPPKDEAGRLVPWTLADRFVADEQWEDEPFVQEGLTLEGAAFERLEWKAEGVFRRCVFRDVMLQDCTLTGFRFEDVVFERCQLVGLSAMQCAFVGCRFTGGRVEGLTAMRSQLARCTFSGVEAPGWQLEECEIARDLFEDTRLSELRATRCTIAARIQGGALLSADLTQCTGEVLSVEGAQVRGVRGLGLELETIELSKLAGGQLSLGQCKLGKLALTGCDALTTFSVVGGSVRDLRIESSPSIQSAMVRGAELGAVHVAHSALADTTFEDVTAPGEGTIEGSTLRGLFFKRGEWGSLRLKDVDLSEYVAVEGTRFASLHKEAVEETPGLERRLEGDRYGGGSMTWRGSDGP